MVKLIEAEISVGGESRSFEQSDLDLLISEIDDYLVSKKG